MGRNDLAAILMALCGLSVAMGVGLIAGVGVGLVAAGVIGAVLVWLLVVDVGGRR